MVRYIDDWGFIKLNRKKNTFLFLFPDELIIVTLFCPSSLTPLEREKNSLSLKGIKQIQFESTLQIQM